MDNWRLLRLETHDAYTNMAIDEAILNAKITGHVLDTVRFYRWNPSAVSIGKFQKMESEVHLDNCKHNNIDVVRRITGGGTVYHDAENEITYSVIVGKKAMQTQDIAVIYAKIYAGLAEGLRLLGITADYDGGNAKTCPNLTVKDRKISGSAQSHKSGVVLQHGTLLLDVRLEKMFTLLRVPWAKTCMEVVNVAKSKITSIKEELGKDISTELVNEALIEGFQKGLNAKLTEGSLTVYERELAEKLRKTKYSTNQWNFQIEKSAT